MTESYECDYCSKSFEHRKSFKNHVQYCGISRLSDFDDSGDFREIENFFTALRKNDYDVQEDSGRKIRQKTIRNKEVNY